MELFLELEIVYIVIGIFIMIVTAIVTTRDFVPKGAFKKGMSIVGAFVAILIFAHYSVTTSRMQEVKDLFNKGETIICENKMRRTVSRSVLLSQELGWRIEDHLFKNPDYERDFHTSRCLGWMGSEPQLEQEKNDRFKLTPEDK
ncbi:MAG: hypothetical protein OQK48_02650 [Sulfurimonas sp.]|uniref:hypothetical protein n=1 Tax=Sulfurimonas sp. TaxID=2022749 RepID=UPI0026092371|nr:hypothetical protein [Sulfurimonas sp.]MCW8895439.1 hypothetical protein [Sulfurimonas sp.]MCW8953823.1 hypothetical protein [Sulfurimonas sp.]MCW9067406.1 hypothetical protein [Sulfurimonas sp.]